MVISRNHNDKQIPCKCEQEKAGWDGFAKVVVVGVRTVVFARGRHTWRKSTAQLAKQDAKLFGKLKGCRNIVALSFHLCSLRFGSVISGLLVLELRGVLCAKIYILIGGKSWQKRKVEKSISGAGIKIA